MPSVQTFVREAALFLNHGPWFSPWSDLAKSNLTGSDTLIQSTAISCIINTVSQFFGRTQAQRAGTPPISSQRLADGFIPTSPISSLRTLATRTLPSCSTRTPSSPTPWFLSSGKTAQAKVLGTLCYSSFEASCDVHLSLLHRLSHFAQYTSTMSWPRNVTLPLIFFSGYTGK